MIAKRVLMKSPRLGKFSVLMTYLTNSQSKTERVGAITVTNCLSDEPQAAIIEILNTQSQNRRSQSDRTYHLILSFPAGEMPDAAMLQALEARMCDALGYAEHQRISVVHEDTDNLHVHIAINKIHPSRYTTHEPRRDFSLLAKACRTLESEFGLKRTNHINKREASEAIPANAEARSANAQLTRWVQENCVNELRAATSWAELHQVFQKNGLTMHERTNGLVIRAENGTQIKASSIGREFSKRNLAGRFGAFEVGCTIASHGNSNEKVKGRAQNPDAAGKLFEQYLQDRADRNNMRSELLQLARARKHDAISAAQQRALFLRALVKLGGTNQNTKKAQYTLIRWLLRNSIKSATQRCSSECRSARSALPNLSWDDWLRQQAKQGSAAALSMLRGRRGPGRSEGMAAGQDAGNVGGNDVRIDSVTRLGTVIYTVAGAVLRDDGEQLRVSHGAGSVAVTAALQMAVERYGECIRVEGSDTFKNRVVAAAVAGKMHIRFDSPGLEQMRKAKMAPHEAIDPAIAQAGVRAGAVHASHRHAKSQRHSPPPHVHKKESRGLSPEATDQDQTARTSAYGSDKPNARKESNYGKDGTGSAVAGSAGRDRDTSTDGGIERIASKPGAGERGRDTARPDLGGVGNAPPPAGRDRLRALSELGVVHIESGGEVLLPRDVPDHVEQQRAAADHGVRRNHSSLNLENASAAAEHYVFEREQKRLKGFDIPKHTRYDGFKGKALYAGLRDVMGQKLGLIKLDEAILVQPVNDVVVTRLKRFKVGQEITLAADGSIRKKGHRR